jgi:glyoxylase-like metal-dependent hydrolase (beta-lactamase superfamily II)
MSNSFDSLVYEFDARPDIGGAMEILPGLVWVRLPLPFLLKHINVWLLRDGDGWAIVDTGLHTQQTRDAWQAVFGGTLGAAPVSRVMVTHMHPDHVGCAGWLCERFGAELWMSLSEYLLCRVLVADTGLPAPADGIQFYRRAGFSQQQLTLYMDMFGSFGKVVAPLPASFHRLWQERSVRIGGHEWQVITGHGHSPEHACLYCPSLNVLISGDQILPTISPNVSVFPTEPGANPLQGWFESLRRMKRRLPDDVLVLPAHGEPFRGVKKRLDELIGEHETGLVRLKELCAQPKRAVDVFATLFKGPVTDKNRIMATGEAIAHLNYLVYLNEMQCETDARGVGWYRTAPVQIPATL